MQSWLLSPERWVPSGPIGRMWSVVSINTPLELVLVVAGRSACYALSTLSFLHPSSTAIPPPWLVPTTAPSVLSHPPTSRSFPSRLANTPQEHFHARRYAQRHPSARPTATLFRQSSPLHHPHRNPSARRPSTTIPQAAPTALCHCWTATQWLLSEPQRSSSRANCPIPYRPPPARARSPRAVSAHSRSPPFSFPIRWRAVTASSSAAKPARPPRCRHSPSQKHPRLRRSPKLPRPELPWPQPPPRSLRHRHSRGT
jgi:hypothetical protein